MEEKSITEAIPQNVSEDLLRSMYISMLRIRLFEERVAELLEAREIKTATHLYTGQEAVAVGVCQNLGPDDYIWGNHRSHGHYLAKGGDMPKLMAELYCKATGCSKGRGGSMHLFSKEVGILGTVPMVAATIPIAVGAALTSVMGGSGRVSVSFFGDGSTEEGVFHESLNFAALKKLPVLFVCENNLLSSHLPLKARRPSEDLYRHAIPYDIPGLQVDGNDVIAVYQATREAVKRARQGGGPTLIECRTYRWRGHVGPKWDLDIGIRDKDELEGWMARCPIKALENKFIEQGIMSEDDLLTIRSQVAEEVEGSVHFARESPYPAREDMPLHVFLGDEGTR